MLLIKNKIKNKKKVVVIIPLYKELNKFEKIALDRCVKVLGKYPFIFVSSRNFKCGIISEYFPKLKYNIERFDNKYFDSLSGYSSLLLKKSFYKRFENYEYLLIYQLDCFVFRDELLRWCSGGFDFIGAPWFDNWIIPSSNFAGRIKNYLLKIFVFKEKKVGNGGFSLRRTSTFIDFLSYFQPIANVFSRLKGHDLSEDIFWSYYAPVLWPSFLIPNFKEALKFSFETYPKKCYRLNGYKLPFGCHAWRRYGRFFWEDIITRYGYKIK